MLYTLRERLNHVYFPTRSFISLIMLVDGSTSLEVGLIGNEAMFGVPPVLGVDVSPVPAVVQGAESALRMDATLFCRELGRSRALQREIDRYVFVHEMTPYERLLGDALRGDASLFASGDCVEAAWRAVDLIFGNVTPVAEYKPNSWGTPAAERIVAGNHGRHNPVTEDATA